MQTKGDPFSEPLSHLDRLTKICVEEASSYGEALRAMRAHRAGSVMVCRDGKVRGIFTERDVLNKCLLENMPESTPLTKLMSTDLVTIKPDATIGRAIAIMHKKHIRNLPLVDKEGRPLGLLTVGRLIRYLADHFPAEVVNLPPTPSQVSQEVEGA